jgi:hypothetical protein
MASDAASISAYVAEFAEAMADCTDPATRTKAAVVAKDGAKASMLTVIRGYAQMIKRNAGVSNEAKIAIGVPVGDAGHTPVSSPATHPQLAVLGATPLTHTIRYSDPSSPKARAKPPGAAALLLFKYVGAEPPASPEQALFVG